MFGVPSIRQSGVDSPGSTSQTEASYFPSMIRHDDGVPWVSQVSIALTQADNIVKQPNSRISHGDDDWGPVG